jgi:hypothetical protein
MIVALFLHASSVFLPFSQTNPPAIPYLTEGFIEYFEPTSQSLVGALVSEGDSLLEARILMSLAEANVVFGDHADFACFTTTGAPNIARFIPFDPPALLFFYEGRFSASVAFPDDDDVLGHQIVDWLDPNYEFIDSAARIWRHLGNMPLTLLVRDNSCSTASYLVAQALRYLRGCSILRLTSAAFSDLGFENETHLLFRKSDMTIAPVKGTIGGLINGSFPYFQHFEPEMFRQQGLFGTYFDAHYDPDVHERLYALGERFTDVRFGVLTPEDFWCVERFNQSSINVPDFLLFDYQLGISYPTHAMRINITEPAWQERAIEYVEHVLHEEIDPKYLSEPVNRSENRGVVTKLVGTTYEEFTSDRDHDIVLFYYFSSIDSANITAEFQAAADEVVRNGTTTMKFGFINTERNSCPHRFPILINNRLVHLIPALNRSNFATMFGMPVKQSYLRFFKAKASLPNNIHADKITVDVAEKEKLVWQFQIPKLPRNVAVQAIEYLHELDTVINGSKKERSPTRSEL